MSGTSLHHRFAGDRPSPSCNTSLVRFIALITAVVGHARHAVFCVSESSGISRLANGDVLVTGGDDSQTVSVFNVAGETWSSAQHMVVGRGYQVRTLEPDRERGWNLVNGY